MIIILLAQFVYSYKAREQNRFGQSLHVRGEAVVVQQEKAVCRLHLDSQGFRDGGRRERPSGP